MADANADIDPSWVSWKVTRNEEVDVSQYCPDRPYLEFEVPAGVKHVHRVVFTTVSHDQGFSDTGGDAKGTYEGSFSWFDVAVIAPSGHDRVDRRRLQHNLHAVFEKKTHVNIWDDRRSNEDKKRYLRAIRAGDLICIFAKSRHVGWKNFVYEAELEVFAEQEDPTTTGIFDLSHKVRSLTVNGSSDTKNTIYRKLTAGSDEIRLIAIQPGAFDDEVVCQLRYALLNDAQQFPYEALSYCWGDSDDVRSIHVENPGQVEGMDKSVTMLVTANLFDALRFLRLDHEERIIWADAVCINQHDRPERSQQVPLMPQIYSQASGIMVWLGQSTEPVVKTIQEAHTIQVRYAGGAGYPRSEEGVSELHHPMFEHGSLGVDSPLFEYEYFHRTWVLQEVFNAKRVEVHCGAYQIEWAGILRLNQCLIKSMLIPNPVGKHVLPALFAGLFEIVEGSSTPRTLSYEPLPTRLGILDVILRGLDLEATEVCDKIFALLTFGEETFRLKTLPESIQPNYQKPDDRIFADFTRWWIRTHRSLRILSAAQVAVGRTWQRLFNREIALEDLDHPTWSLWHTGKSFWARATLGLATDCAYSASLDTPPDVDILDEPTDPLTLTLVGNTVAAIRNVGPYPFYQLFKHTEECSVSDCPLDMLHAAYTHLFDPLDERGTWRYGALHLTPQLEEYRRRNTALETTNKLNDHLRTHIETLRETGAIKCHGTCYFETENEELKGLCPPGTEEGDIVVVLHGGKVPYVLRPKEEAGKDDQQQYLFVGECYLQEYMHGRAIGENLQEDGKLANEVFHLV